MDDVRLRLAGLVLVERLVDLGRCLHELLPRRNSGLGLLGLSLEVFRNGVRSTVLDTPWHRAESAVGVGEELVDYVRNPCGRPTAISIAVNLQDASLQAEVARDNSRLVFQNVVVAIPLVSTFL